MASHPGPTWVEPAVQGLVPSIDVINAVALTIEPFDRRQGAQSSSFPSGALRKRRRPCSNILARTLECREEARRSLAVNDVAGAVGEDLLGLATRRPPDEFAECLTESACRHLVECTFVLGA
jgi:hypothetical protein